VQSKISVNFYQDPVFWVLVGAGPLVVFGITITIPDLVVTPLDNLIPALLVLLIYPSLEEIVFRGVIMDSLARTPVRNLKIGWLSFANLISAALFSLSHLWGHTLGWALAVFIPGLVFGIAKERWGSLRFPIFFHSFYNACFFGLVLV
jgi:hypothetical protein